MNKKYKLKKEQLNCFILKIKEFTIEPITIKKTFTKKQIKINYKSIKVIDY